MNKVELLNYIHWFSLKTQFKNTSGSVQLRLHNLNMTSPCLAGWGGGRIRSSLRTVISHTRLLVAPNAAPHLLASSRLWYQRAQKRWIKVMWRVTFAGRAFHFITNIQVWILFNQPSWNIRIQWGLRSLAASVTFLGFDYRVWISALWLGVIVIIWMWLSDYWGEGGAGRVI